MWFAEPPFWLNIGVCAAAAGIDGPPERSCRAMSVSWHRMGHSAHRSR